MALLPRVKFLDPAKMVAQEVRKFLRFNRMLRKSGNGQLEIQVSDKKSEFERILRTMGYTRVNKRGFSTYLILMEIKTQRF